MAMDDDELMRRSAEGDSSAFEEIVRRHQQAVWGIAWRYFRDADEAEDVAQDAFLRLLEAAPHYRPKAALSAYIRKIAVRLCLDRSRRKKPIYVAELPERADPSPSPADSMLSDERRKQVREAILQLPERQRLAIALRHAEGLGYREIADAMNLTPKAVERLLARARKSLLSLLLD